MAPDKSLAAEIEAVCDTQEHIRNLECIGRRHNANGICRKAIDAGIAALKAQAEQAAWLFAAGAAPDDAGAVAWYQSVKASCDQTLRQQKLKIRDLEAEIAALQSRAFEDGATPADIRRFAEAILHGDDEHRDWLTEAAECFVTGRSLPPPRGKGTQTLPLQPEGERNA